MTPSNAGRSLTEPHLNPATAALQAQLQLLCQGLHPDPSSLLGRWVDDSNALVRVFLPGIEQPRLADVDQPLQSLAKLGLIDLFEWRGPASALPTHYQVLWRDPARQERMAYDPYDFGPQLSRADLRLFNDGRCPRAYRILGSHLRRVDGISGVLFAVWAPRAAQVSVVGDFNDWNPLRHPLRRRDGVWELFIPEVGVGVRYQFAIRSASVTESVPGIVEWQRKIDPYAQAFERRPSTAALVSSPAPYPWQDGAWMAQRRSNAWMQEPLSVYEVHLSSWRRTATGDYLNYRELAQQLVAYAVPLGFTHLELMPITEHPLDDSWGYQTIGYFAPTSRHGDLNDFRWLVDYCHQAGLGVILDWVPGHFPKDAQGLARFDGGYLYEHPDPDRREQRGWGTFAFDYGRNQVRNFLLASACFWLEECHLDGLRVDAVASMLYLDYDRQSGEWVPNRFGGNANLEAVAFLRELNRVVDRRYPGVVMIAEESTAWPLVTRPVWTGGLGFGMKWNMGWMHDILEYLGHDPSQRRYHHELLTFSLLYAFTEKYMLPLSHDEVVYGKGSLLSKMPGSRSQQLANLRLLYLCMWTYPGKKFLFMGGEIAQQQEWRFSGTLDWELLEEPLHCGIQALVRDLNRLYRSLSSLHRLEFAQEGFEWLDSRDAERSVVAYLRRADPQGGAESVLVVLNFSAAAHLGYRVGVPLAEGYRVVLNSGAALYGGDSVVYDWLCTEPVPWMGQPYSLVFDLPPLTGLLLVPVGMTV